MENARIVLITLEPKATEEHVLATTATLGW